jgi:DNA polymerase-1
LKKTPALNQLITDVKTTVKKRGYLIGLDKRMLTARSEHSALNLLLQSAGAIVMKKATCLLWDELDRQGFKYGDDVVQVLHIHDEFQLYVRNGLEEQVGKIAVNAIKQAGEFFNFRCPLDGEYKVGKNWADTH